MLGMQSIKGAVVLQKRDALDLDFCANFIDGLAELFGRGITLQLVGITDGDHIALNATAKLSEPARLQNWIRAQEDKAKEKTTHSVEFKWQPTFGIPGACLIKNNHRHEFFLNSVTVDVPGQGHVYFVCNSWVYPDTQRTFFSNKGYLPSHTPAALLNLRNEELVNLRGNGSGKREKPDRIYDYDVYNDLGDPDRSDDLKRQVLGGSAEFPYPRRCRTGRPRNKKDPATESRLAITSSLNIFVPRDERFGYLKLSDFLGYGLRSIGQVTLVLLDRAGYVLGSAFKSLWQCILSEPKSRFESTVSEFDSFEEILKLYSNGEKVLKFPKPQVIASDELAWRKDEEFARQMLSGVNPVTIQRLQKFPPSSKLDPEKYGPQGSTITASHIQENLEGITVEQALRENKLFILDHHDVFMPYVNRINALDSIKVYATRTILFLKKDGTLKPVAIELSLPPSEEKQYFSKVLTPAEEGTQGGALWQLAKAYVAVNDSGYHQLISHWLRTHAIIEPFVIATNRQLSFMHPIHKLLYPHFKDTMNINAFARQILINAGGIFERTVFPGKYAIEMSAIVYRDHWRFDQEGLPADLLKRGMAVEDKEATYGLRLVIEDYPFAVDGLEIWSAIESWVKEYVSFYYMTDEIVKSDPELQAWWDEIRNVGHADKTDEEWWYKMEKKEELSKTLTTMIWVASALHAAVNFGQYPYAGYMPDRPTVSRRLIPEEGSPDFLELVKNPDLFFLRTVSNQFQTAVGIALIEILSMHSRDEVYLGQRSDPHWTSDIRALNAFEHFASELKKIENNIRERNKDERLKNRSGPAHLPYTLLYPDTSNVGGQSGSGLTGKGIPNSVSI